MQELNRTCKYDSKLLASSMQALNQYGVVTPFCVVRVCSVCACVCVCHGPKERWRDEVVGD